MDTEFEETMFIIKGPRAEHEEDLKQVLGESGVRRKSGPRGPQKRRIPLCTDHDWFLGNHFGGIQDAPSGSEGRNGGHRINKPHWTTEEVFKLIDGLEEYGAGRWLEIKKKYFSAPVRTADNLSAPVRSAANLKDKWRNLRKSYTGNAKRRYYQQLPKYLVERIQMLAINNL